MNEGQIPIESEFNKLNISDKVSNSAKFNHENCYEPGYRKFWCEECVPSCIIEGWTSENSEIDKFIKDTIYNPGYDGYPLFLEWVAFDRFESVEQIGEGGFAKVYSATWIDGRAKYDRNSSGNWEKLDPEPKEVALKRLNGSQNISAKYLNELKIHWDIGEKTGLYFYGITKYPETNEFMMIIQFMEQGNLKYVLSNNFNNSLWKNKIEWLCYMARDLKKLHKLGYCHKDFHSGNILRRNDTFTYISDFGLSGPSNEQDDNKIYGVLPYIAPEVLNGKPYTLSSDIYSFGVIMTELSSGEPPFHKRKHNECLALEICNGLRPDFGKGTPEIYKKLAHRCMNADPDQRPTADGLYEILNFWYKSVVRNEYQETEKFSYKGKEIRAMFEEADKEIPNISTYCEKDPDAVYTSRAFTFSNLSKPVNSSVITAAYLNDEENNKDFQDSQAVDLEIPNSLPQLRDVGETD